VPMNSPEFDRGDPVVVYAPSFYKDSRIGIFLGPCKDHDNSYRVLLINPDVPIKEVCANLKMGDTIEKVRGSTPY